jgi:tetratricopeptide (TPR) repeat protein
MSSPEGFGRATEIWKEAYQHQMRGELDRAIELYQRSIEVHPTAEAHTFLGWTYSFQGRLDEATQGVCGPSTSIRLRQPTAIGCYLMQREARPGGPVARGARAAARTATPVSHMNLAGSA